jgi:hypothetical protein
MLVLQERNRRALELLLQKDATIRSLQQQLQQCSSDPDSAAASTAKDIAVSAALSRAEAAEAALQQVQQQHAQALVSNICVLNTAQILVQPAARACLMNCFLHCMLLRCHRSLSAHDAGAALLLCRRTCARHMLRRWMR